MSKEPRTKKKTDFLYDYDDIIDEGGLSKSDIEEEEHPFLVGEISEKYYTEFFIQTFKSLNRINKYIVMLVLRFMDHKFYDNETKNKEIDLNGLCGMAKINEDCFQKEIDEIVDSIAEEDSLCSSDGESTLSEEYIRKVYSALLKDDNKDEMRKKSRVYEYFTELYYISKTMRLFASKYWNENCNSINWLFETLSMRDKESIIMLARKLKYFYNDIDVEDKQCPATDLDLGEYLLQRNDIFEMFPKLIDKEMSYNKDTTD